jgi:hypothetical protein
MDEHELYGIAREQFIAERTAWVKALRAEGRREDAARVAELRKPSVAAATVNRLVRTEPDRFAVLVDAGDSLRAAQDRMLSGGGTAAEVRDAVERERAAVEALLSVAAEPGMSGAVSDRVAGTLHAAALNPEARDQVRRGQLVEELQHVGFGGASLATGPPPSPSGQKRSTTSAGRKPGGGQPHNAQAHSRADAKRAEERERAEQRRLTEERARARRAEREARRRLGAAARALANAEQRHATTSAAFRDAENKLVAARTEAQAATASHDTAQRALDSL